jgi:predicted nucleotide-binding protein
VSGTRGFIAAIFGVFDESEKGAFVPSPPPPPEPALVPRIFIGRGHDQLWRDLKDHLHEKHGFVVQAYETAARAGHTIRDILADLVGTTDFAILVLTADDKVSASETRARQNVVHETGLFQGRLGFNRAIVLLEDGVEEFSNLYGIQQIRFSKGNIKETFGEVIATLRREFPN